MNFLVIKAVFRTMYELELSISWSWRVRSRKGYEEGAYEGIKYIFVWIFSEQNQRYK